MLAHEFAHIKNRDILVSSIAAGATGAQLLGHPTPLAERVRRLRELDHDQAPDNDRPLRLVA